MFEVDVISRKELLACLVGLHCFREFVEGKIVNVYSDNENAVAADKRAFLKHVGNANSSSMGTNKVRAAV